MIQLRKLGRRALDLEFPTLRGFRVRIVERPGRWMAADALAELVADLRTVAATSVAHGELHYGVLTGEHERLESAVLTVVYQRRTRRPVAFNALSILEVELHGHPEEVLHLGLAVVDPEFRSRGLSWLLYGVTVLLRLLRRRLRPIWVTNVSQVPAVVGMVDESFTQSYPTMKPSRRRRSTHLTIAQQLLARYRRVFGVGDEAGFDEERFVITNAYTGGSDNLKKSYAEAPKHRDDVYNALCERQLDYARGDDFLQIGRYDLKVAIRHAWRRLRSWPLWSKVRRSRRPRPPAGGGGNKAPPTVFDPS